MFPELLLHRLAVLFSLVLLVACAAKPPPPAPAPAGERITLLPDASGKVGAVIVTSSTGSEVRLDRAYDSATLDVGGVTVRSASEAEVKARYQSVLQAMPVPARSYTLLFVNDRTTLLPESVALLRSILSDYHSRAAAEVAVIGHTDRTGDARYNEDLSRRRAAEVRDMLESGGIPASAIEISWRGDREPAVATPGRTSEQRNRRVEVKLR